MEQQSQLENLPPDLPFRIISKTIGRGAYASIKKAIPLETNSPVFAVKLIHKPYAIKRGGVSAKQLGMEVSLHAHVGQHPNVIEWFATGEDTVWRWIAMEFADGGDLFDKIEADVGVPPDVAHVYFHQLVSAISFVHSKGVAHRDLKPENLLLSADGCLKLADFGMATMFEYKGQRKLSSSLCGSPPYIAPEILSCAANRPSNASATGNGRSDRLYAAELSDLWSCGVILFVLLVGNTPWEEPSSSSWEYVEYVRTAGRSSDALWERIPSDALSLLRGIMAIDPQRRFSLARTRQHPWYTRPNPLLDPSGRVRDPVLLATQMLESLHIDLAGSQQPAAGISPPPPATASAPALALTQPELVITDAAWDWEPPPLRSLGATAISSTQPTGPLDFSASVRRDIISSTQSYRLPSFLADEPVMSQFSYTPAASMTLTQQARCFRDILPGATMARFVSHVPPTLLVQMLADALHQLSVPLPVVAPAGRIATLRVRTTDGRRQRLHGEIHVDPLSADPSGLLEARFVKVVGDPLEWRRFFKKVVVLCRDAVYVPDA